MEKTKKVTGTVKDTDGLALIGVNIVVKGATRGTTTDLDGNFSLDLSSSDVLQVSYIGYITQEIQIKGQKILNITLSKDNKLLDEVVVVGYGSQKKTTLTAAVSTLKSDDIKDLPTPNITNMLAGRVTGILGAQGGGQPGSDGSHIFIRGVATTGNCAPLCFVDGVQRDYSRIDPATIETFSVLKDAAAVAPYGMAGANGVILITTKKGKTGKPKVNYSGFYAMQNPTRVIDRLNSYEYAVAKNTADRNSGNPETFTKEALEGYQKTVSGASDANPDRYPNSNAYDEYRQRNTPYTGHSLSLSGGTEAVSYFIGLGYQYQEGMWSSANQQRFNLTANLEAKPTKTTTIRLNLSGWNQVVKQAQSDAWGTFGELSNYLPIDVTRFSDGKLGANNLGAIVEGTLYAGYKNDDETKIFTQLIVNQELPFIKGLSLKGIVSYDPTFEFYKRWTEPKPDYYRLNADGTKTVFKDSNKPSLRQEADKWYNLTYQGMINYHNTFGKHSVGGLVVAEARGTNWMGFGVSRANYQTTIEEINMGNPDQKNWSTNGSSSYGRQVGFVFKGNYMYDNRYMIEASGRYDGHYYFAPGKRFGFFPAVSIGWRASQESFMKDFKHLDNLKLRASVGQSGNLAGNPFQYSSNFSILETAVILGGIPLQGLSERAEPNPFITWEKATKYDVGVEVSLWNGLLTAEADYFFEKRANMLASPNVTVPVEYGVGISQVNAAEMQNQGFELTLGSTWQINKDWRVSINGNFSFARNKFKKIFEAPHTYDFPERRRTGRPWGTQFGLDAIGLFQESDFDKEGNLIQDQDNDGINEIATHTFSKVRTGDIKYRDVNGDGKITGEDECVIGKPILPEIIYGFNPKVSYKDFDFSVFFQGTGNSSLILTKELISPFLNGTGNPTRESVEDSWSPTNTNARFPRMYVGGSENNVQRSSWWVWNSSYLRVKNIELGYSLPKEIMQKANIEHLRFYVAGQNLLTFTKLPFIDPEVNSNGGGDNNARGFYYPQQQAVQFGVNITF
ncbi:MAG: TonB-dependent receptor [Tannerellaceae bacterium]